MFENSVPKMENEGDGVSWFVLWPNIIRAINGRTMSWPGHVLRVEVWWANLKRKERFEDEIVLSNGEIWTFLHNQDRGRGLDLCG